MLYRNKHLLENRDAQASGGGLTYHDPNGGPVFNLDEIASQNLVTHAGDQFIGFKVHTEEFLLSVLPVREIIMLPHITYAPKSDTGVEGIIALRGEIMPVLNLRRFFGFPRGAAEAQTRVIILHSDFGGFGIIIDAITEFVWLQASDVESIPQNFFAPGYKVLNGVAKIGERVRGIVDVGKMVQGLVPAPVESVG